MLKNVKDQYDSFSYIFTKFGEEYKTGVNKKLKTIRKKLSTKLLDDKAYVALFEDLIEKTEDEEIIHLNPLKDKKRCRA